MPHKGGQSLDLLKVVKWFSEPKQEVQATFILNYQRMFFWLMSR